MRLRLLLAPLGLLILAACVDVHEQPTPKETVVTPAPSQPSTVYSPPGSNTTVVTHP